MAMLTMHHAGNGLRSTSTPSTSFFATPLTYIRTALRRRRDERTLEGLSPELLKDIGWPGTDAVDIDRKN